MNLNIVDGDRECEALFRELSDYEVKSIVTKIGEIVEKEFDAKDLFMKLCKNNWDFAEPGVLYWDRIEKYNILSEDKEFKYSGVNPLAN